MGMLLLIQICRLEKENESTSINLEKLKIINPNWCEPAELDSDEPPTTATPNAVASLGAASLADLYETPTTSTPPQHRRDSTISRRSRHALATAGST